jgi:hypothetical protein
MVLRPGVRWRPASNRDVTLKTVAALAGVSYGTVWRAVNGRARIAPETQARIMDLVRDLDYQPNPAGVGRCAACSGYRRLGARSCWRWSNGASRRSTRPEVPISGAPGGTSREFTTT